MRSYAGITDKLFDESNKRTVFARLLFGFCFFHAVAQDRRKFGPIGWNIPYGFTQADLMTNRKQLMAFVNQYDETPYKVLNYLGAAINYGGRVTDDKDKRLISSILRTYINEDLVLNGQEYKFSNSGTYYCPDAENVQQYMEYIQGLPLNPAPEAFGMDPNCAITTAQAESMAILEGMLTVSAKGGSGAGGKSMAEVMDETAEMVQNKIPELFPLDVVELNYPTMYSESLNTVIKQECLRYNKLIKEMVSTLREFRRALKGLVLMSADLDQLGKEMYNNFVPTLWGAKGFLSLKPLSAWIYELIERIEFLDNWFKGGTPPVYWVSGFFFPQAFFTATLQNYARKDKIAIDIISLAFSIRDDIPVEDFKKYPNRPENGVLGYGMFLEGARWCFEKHTIAHSRPKELYTSLPMLNFVPVADRVVPSLAECYMCPLYKVLSRKGTLLTTGHSTNFVMNLELPSSHDQDHWIKAGVAAFLSLKT
jgi:dynein heavy chain